MQFSNSPEQEQNVADSSDDKIKWLLTDQVNKSVFKKVCRNVIPM